MKRQTGRSFCLLAILFVFVRAGASQAWSQLLPSGTLPNPRHGSGVYAPRSNRLIVFGDYALNPRFLNDLWILSGANGTGTPAWQQAIAPGAVGSPPPRESPGLVYDQSTNRMILFGGLADSVAYNDLWILVNADGTTGTPTWVQQSPTNSPPGRGLHTAVYDPASNRMIIFGGQTLGSFGTFLGDLWVLTNANGTDPTPPAWIQLSPSGSLPTPRSHHAAAYDSSRNRMVIYAGEGLVDTWVLSNANGLGGPPAWTLLAPSGQPPPQNQNTRVEYDPQTQRLILFGGTDRSNFSTTNATFVLINAMGNGSPTWQPLTPTGTLPPPRVSWAGGYDQSSNKLIVFGGQNIGPSGAPLLNDTWVLTNANGLAGAQLSLSQVSRVWLSSWTLTSSCANGHP